MSVSESFSGELYVTFPNVVVEYAYNTTKIKNRIK